MSLPRRTFALLLATTPGIGGRTVTRVLARNDLLSRTPEQFLRLSSEAWREEYKLNARAATNLLARRKTAVEETAGLEERLTKLDVSWITAADAHYPHRIEEMDPDPPGLLFLYGNLRLLDSKTFCVLASRKAPPAALNDIERLTEEGVLSAETLVTGHDTPEYQRSAIVPLRWGSPRILCLDRGLFQALGEDLLEEPFRAARLWRYQFDSATDLVVSPFKPDAGFVGVNNQVRDRLIACLSSRLDFCHVAPGGNMEKLAKRALKAGRQVRVSDRIFGYRGLLELGAEVLPSI